MKNCFAILVTLLLCSCYGSDITDGDPVECTSQSQCDDRDPCTFDFCESGECAHVNTCEPPPECESAADCDDADECTLDFCDAGTCAHHDICPEPECDPSVRILALDNSVGTSDLASDGEIILMALAGRGTEQGAIVSLDPNEPEAELVVHSLIEDENRVIKPFVIWPDGENPRLFWTSVDEEDDTAIMYAEFTASALTGRQIVFPPEDLPRARLNDVKPGPDNVYGLAIEVERADAEMRTFFMTYSPESGVSHISELSPRYSHLPVLASLPDGWTLGFTERTTGGGPGTVFFSQYHLPSTYDAALAIASEETMFATRAMVNTSNARILLYERYATEDIKQLFAGWLMEDGSPFSLDLGWQTVGVDALGSYADERAIMSWCSLDLATGTSSVRASSFSSTELLTTEFWADMAETGCSRTQLVAVGEDTYLVWLPDSGASLYMKNLSCH